MDDYISRQAAVEALKDEWVGVPVYYLCGEDIFEYSKFRIESLPSVQPRKGLWIDIKHTFMTKCSVCDWINNDDSSYNFCPDCGADMRGDSDEND